MVDDATPRPWTLWAFSLILALIGAYNLLLAWDNLAHAGEYGDLGVSYPPRLRAAAALIWGIAFVAVGIGLARRKGWARRSVVLVLSNYGAFGVLWLLVYARSDFGRERIPFQAALTAALVGLVAWIMRWRRMRRPFYDQQPSEDRTA